MVISLTRVARRAVRTEVLTACEIRGTSPQASSGACHAVKMLSRRY
jgi:hypothetical protein